MIRLVPVAALLVVQLACTIGDPEQLDPAQETWWLSLSGLQGDCPMPADIGIGPWGRLPGAEGSLELADPFADPLGRTTLVCEAKADACLPITDAAGSLHTTLIGVRADQESSSGTAQIVGTCGADCPALSTDAGWVSCEGTAAWRLERILGGTVQEASAGSCDALGTPSDELGATHVLYLANASSDRGSWRQHGGGVITTALGLDPGVLARVESRVGAVVEVLGEDGGCLAARVVQEDLHLIVVDAQGGYTR